jgi:uncharacterized repeat protein (TIGR04138 family)
MQEVNFEEKLDGIIAIDPRFQRDAYVFMREALDFTQKLVSRENQGKVRHVSGQELLDGLRQYALQQFGPMTVTVFEEWGIQTCQDFGAIVFNMVESGLLAKTDKDTQADFQNGYNFTDAFCKPFWPANRLKAGHPAVAAAPKITPQQS